MTDPTAPNISVATPTGSLPAAPPQRPVTPPPQGMNANGPKFVRGPYEISADLSQLAAMADRMPSDAVNLKLRTLAGELHVELHGKP